MLGSLLNNDRCSHRLVGLLLCLVVGEAEGCLSIGIMVWHCPGGNRIFKDAVNNVGAVKAAEKFICTGVLVACWERRKN